MDGFRTLGQRAAVAASRAMLAAGMPHAVLLAGPSGVGKTTLAMDVAAALLCTADPVAARPCRACRGCRMVEHGNHPDLHRLVPAGPGATIRIGGNDERGVRAERGVRDLVRDLSLLPVEGGGRVAIVEQAQRMTEDAQSAFLKTLEEPPSGTTILLCADDEDRLLPTIRSRCARIRLGPLGVRDVEAVLVARGVADAPTAARLARLTDGRPGHAIAYALAAGAATIRGEIARTLLDLLALGAGARISGIRDLAGRATELARELEAGAARATTEPDPGAVPGRGNRSGAPGGSRSVSARTTASARATAAQDAAATAADRSDGATDGAEVAGEGPVGRVAPAERRRGAIALVGIWRSVLRDLALVSRGATSSVRELDLLDDLAAAAVRVGPDGAGAFMRELAVAGERLEGNVSPELVLDVLALHWTATARGA